MYQHLIEIYDWLGYEQLISRYPADKETLPPEFSCSLSLAGVTDCVGGI